MCGFHPGRCSWDHYNRFQCTEIRLQGNSGADPLSFRELQKSWVSDGFGVGNCIFVARSIGHWLIEIRWEFHDFWNPGIQESGNPGIQGPRDPGIQGSRDPGIREPWNPGIQESRRPGIQESWNLGIREGCEDKKSFRDKKHIFLSLRKAFFLSLKLFVCP